MAKTRKAEIRASLEAQLQDRGADVGCYQALLDDYMFYWEQQRKMQRSVKADGLIIDTISAQGKACKKENPAVKMAALYNKQMLQILKELGLTTETCRPPDEAGGDL